MRKNYFILFGILTIFSFACYAKNTSPACFEHPILAEAEDEEAFLNALSEEDLEDIKQDGNPDISVFKADVLNNGTRLYAVTSQFTVQHRIEIHPNFFKKTGKAFKAFTLPNSANLDVETASDDFIRKLCGKTYLVYSHSYGGNVKMIGCEEEKNKDDYLCHLVNEVPDAYIVENNVLKHACDNNWAHYQRILFNEKYKSRDYESAYKELKYYTEKCHGQLDPHFELWLQNDVLLAMYKDDMNDEEKKEAKMLIAKIEKSRAYPASSAQFKKAFLMNKNLALNKR